MMLRKISGSSTYWLFIASSPFWLFTIFFEKYVLAILPIVILTYSIVSNDNKTKIISCALAPGLLTTSAVAVPLLAVHDKKNGALSIVKSCGLIIGLVAVIGRINVLFHFSELLKGVMGFTKPDMDFMHKLYSCFDLLASSLFVLPFNVTESGRFWWISIADSINWIGLIILVICLIGYIANYRKPEFIVFVYWLCFMFGLFIIIGWSPEISPLFAAYFSWAIIPLFVSGMHKIIKEKYFRASINALITICVACNIYHVVNIIKYFVFVY